MDKTASNH